MHSHLRERQLTETASTTDFRPLRIRMDNNWRFQTLPLSSPTQDGTPVTQWYERSAGQEAANGLLTEQPGSLDNGLWNPYKVGDDAFANKRGFAWFRAALPSMPSALAGMRRIIHFEGFDDNATVFFNHKFLRRQVGYDNPFDADVTDLWNPNGNNELVALVENTGGPGGISEPVTVQDRPLHPVAAPVPATALPGYDDRAWRVVHLPHDYVVEQKFTPTADAGHGSLPTPMAWYRKTFTVPLSYRGKSVWIDFDGVYRDATVYLNGHELGEHQSGYTGFRYDIGKMLNYGASNTLAVHVDPHKFEGWFYEGGGIYRHVWLNVADPVHIAPDGVYVTSQLPEPGPSGKAPLATVTVKTTLQNDGVSPAHVALMSWILDDKGSIVSHAGLKSAVVPAGGTDVVTERFSVARPRLWSIEHPHLYRVKQSLGTGIGLTGKTPLRELDFAETHFGIRTLRFDPNKGFFLNGKRVEIKGTCNHQDFAGVGIGMPDRLLDWRVKKLKEMGSNAYRTSHNPVAPELLDACDRLGMLVMDENRHLGDTYQPKSNNSTPLGDLADWREMLVRDRNHPSIIMWSICNEEFAIEGNSHGAELFAAMKKVGQQYDNTRPFTCAMDSQFGQGISNVEDLQGFNYRIAFYDSFHKSHPNQPCYGSETSSDVSTRGIYADDPTRGYVRAYDMESPSVNWGYSAEDAWQPIADRPWMEGGFVWTGFDYKGEPTPYGWPCVNSHFGIMDEAGFPKDNFYYYQSVWGDKPIVHILPHWNWRGKEGQPINVWAYSNADRVELLLNGKSLGTKAIPHLRHAEWTVPYAPGVLEARGYRGSRLIATDRVATTGAPAALRVRTDSTKLQADSEDVSMVEVSVVDAQGRVVPTADNLVTFKATGAVHIAGVGNGDPSDHDPDKASYRRAFNGRCLAVVQAGDSAGGGALIATSPGLKPARIDLAVGY